MLRVLRDLAGACCGGMCAEDFDADETLLRADLPANLKLIRRLGRGGEGVAFLVEETVWLSAEEQRLADEEAEAEAEAAGDDANAERGGGGEGDAATAAAAAAAAAAAGATPGEHAGLRRGGGVFLKARTALGIRLPAADPQPAPLTPQPSRPPTLAARSLPAAATPSAAPQMRRRLWALKAVRRGPGLDAPGLLAEVRNQARLGGHPNIVALAEVLLTRRHLCLKMDVAAGGPLLDLICAYKPPAPQAAGAQEEEGGAGEGAAAAGEGGGTAAAAKTGGENGVAGGGEGGKGESGEGGRRQQQGHMPEPLARYYFVQLAHAVAHCHALRVAHRDLKLANVLVDGASPPVVKLIDFGLSTTPALMAVRRSGGSGRWRQRAAGGGGGGGDGKRRGARQRQGSGAPSRMMSRSPSLMDRIRGVSPDRQQQQQQQQQQHEQRKGVGGGGIGGPATAASSAGDAASSAAHPLLPPPPPVGARSQPCPSHALGGGAPPSAALPAPPLRLGSNGSGGGGGGGSSGGGGGSGLSSPAIGSSPRSWVAAAFGGTYQPPLTDAASGGAVAEVLPTAGAMPPTALGGGGGAAMLPPLALGAARPPPPPLVLPLGPPPDAAGSSLGSPFAAMAAGGHASHLPRATGMSPASSGPLSRLGSGAWAGAVAASAAPAGSAGGDSPPPRMLPRSNTAVGTPAYMAPELLSSIVHRGREVQEAHRQRQEQQQQQQQQQQRPREGTTPSAFAAAAAAPDNAHPSAAGAGRHHPAGAVADPSAVAPYDPYKVDVWALGCILFAMLTRRFPFAAAPTGGGGGAGDGADGDSLAGLQAQLQAIRAARQPGDRGRTHLSPGLWRALGVSAQVADLLDGMLALDPRGRLSLPRVLAHPWCRGVVPRTGGYAGALRRLAWLGAYRADEAAAGAVVGGSSTGGSSEGGRAPSGGSPTWRGAAGGARGGAAPGSPGGGSGGGDGSGWATPTLGGGGGRGRAPSGLRQHPPHADDALGPGGGSPPAGASPRGGSPTRLQRRSTAAATFAETLLQATATYRGVADEAETRQIDAAVAAVSAPGAAGGGASRFAAGPPATLGGGGGGGLGAGAACGAGASPLGGQGPSRQNHQERPRPRPAPLPAPVLSPECEQALAALVAAAVREGPQAARTLRWRPRWRQPPPMIASRPPPAVPVLKLSGAMIL